MKGLAPQTSELFDAVTRLDCIKPFVLVGGTALSLQLNARQSEDLDLIETSADKKHFILYLLRFRMLAGQVL